MKMFRLFRAHSVAHAEGHYTTDDRRAARTDAHEKAASGVKYYIATESRSTRPEIHRGGGALAVGRADLGQVPFDR